MLPFVHRRVYVARQAFFTGGAKMLTSTELGEALGLAKSTVLRMANEGKIPCFRLDNVRGDYRFDLGEVKDALRVKAIESK